MTYYFNKKWIISDKSLQKFTTDELIQICKSKSVPLKKIIIKYLTEKEKIEP